LDPNVLRDAKKRIGRKWKQIQSKYPNTYSGLSIRSLADAAGSWFPQWYGTVYKGQSLPVHGVDPIAYVNVDITTETVEPRWFSTNDNIRYALYCGNMLFLGFTYYMNDYIDLGDATNMLIRGYMDELKSLYQESPTGG
jgi:hypothetical protein